MDKYYSELMTLGEALDRAYLFCPTMDSKVVLSYYPARAYYKNPATGLYDSPENGGGIFSYNFFDSAGKNFGVYIPDLGSLQLFARPRIWTIEKEGIRDVNNLLTLLREDWHAFESRVMAWCGIKGYSYENAEAAVVYAREHHPKCDGINLDQLMQKVLTV